jgi:hypothetical protein
MRVGAQSVDHGSSSVAAENTFVHQWRRWSLPSIVAWCTIRTGHEDFALPARSLLLLPRR